MRVVKGRMSDRLLNALASFVENTETEGMFSYSAQMRSLLGIKSQKDKSALSEAIKRLREKGIIEEEIESTGETILKLTSLGRDFLGKDEKWDGKYRIVIWDIPESKRAVRDLLRRRLSEWGFKRWQQSVWISKRNATKKLRALVRDLNMERNIAVIESDDPALSHIT